MNWESKFMKWGNRWWNSHPFDYVLPWLTHIGSHFGVIVFILLSWIVTRELRIFFGLLLLYAIQNLIIYLLKFIVRRRRPLPRHEMEIRVSKGPGEIIDPSFPSAHTTFSFMTATVLSSWFPRYQLLFFPLAGFIGWTRIYLGLHYPTDVIGGALLGYGITKIFLLYMAV